MIYKPPIWIIFCLVAISLGRGMRLPPRERPYMPANLQLEHRIGDVFQRISSPSRVSREPTIHPQLKSDLRAAIFVLRETQHQILSVVSVQSKIQEKLAYWKSAPKFDDDDNAVPSELRPEQANTVEHQLAQLMQRLSSGSSHQEWAKTSRINKPFPASDNKDPPTLYSAIKEAASALQETHLQISSVLSVQADIQERLNYWQAELAKTIMDNPADGLMTTENDPRHPAARTNSAPTTPLCNPDDVESKSGWLFKAFECNSSLNVAFWILSGANWHWRSKNQTALQLAVSRSWRPAVELLIKRGADCRIRSSEQEETLLHQTIRDSRVDFHIFRLLIGVCDVNATNSKQRQTALHLAGEQDRPDLADLLIKQGRAYLEAQDVLGYRPLHSAVRSPKLVAMLVAFGADIGAVTHTGMTPLHLAVIENQIDTVRILVKAGAKVATPHDSYGHTPLDYAAMLSERGSSHDYEMQALLAPYAAVDEYFLDMPSE